MNWLEVCLIVEGEVAEAVADVLARYAPDGGVVIESTAIQTRPDDPGGKEEWPDEGRPVGPFAVRCYLPADERLEETRRRLDDALWHLGQILPLPAAQFRPVADADWSETWKANYQPIRLGRRLVIVPAWLDPPLNREEVAVRLEPGMAFGTGTHPTTHLCLALLEEVLQPGQSVIDLGCGSGILAIAAARLGAGSVLAVDIDPEAVRTARLNAAANGLARNVHVEQGSLADILASNFELSSAGLVFANILARVIVQFAEHGLARLLAPGGNLIVSGILADQVGEVEDSFRAQGIIIVERRQIEDWVALLCRVG